jgi:hypothetical protein
MGHQAAQCTTGTVNWRSMYGEDAFRMRPTLFQSDIEAAAKSKQIDLVELEKNARAYAKARKEGTLPGAAPNSGPPPAAAAPAAAAPAARPPPPSDLAPGWAAAQDAAGKTYYWHKETKAVQWDKPYAAGAGPPAAAPAAAAPAATAASAAPAAAEEFPAADGAAAEAADADVPME